MPDVLRGEDGSTVVEAVIVVPVFMLVLLLACQAVLWAEASQSVQSAAALGDQIACSYSGSVSSGISAADTMLASHSTGLVADESVTGEVLPASMAEIKVTGMAESIVPGMHFPVSAVRIGPEQRYRMSG
ncbi:MAG: pilus assembly protein [Actinobacteria bacterium]|nr:pilus assembly protein [Actinomycetota bacterium]MCL5447245.1 pilus assembly protein [Actinomycetota bacterium]